MRRWDPRRLPERAWHWLLGEARSEEHTSELQSQSNLVCRPLLEKKNNPNMHEYPITRTVARIEQLVPGARAHLRRIIPLDQEDTRTSTSRSHTQPEQLQPYFQHA